MSLAARLEFALRNLAPTQWLAFEQFCNAFLLDDFGSLRPHGGPGDKGRDAKLFVNDYEGVVVQYSIASDWRAKIRDTVRVVLAADIPLRQLIFVTNQEIGPRGDGLQAELRTTGVALDACGREWFYPRIQRSDLTREAATELAAMVVDPLLPSEAHIRPSRLGDAQLRAGLLYLELHLRDASNQRSLTRLIYESFVLEALSHVPTGTRVPRTALLDRVHHHCPSHDRQRIKGLVDSAVVRLKRQHRVTWESPTDSFALHYDERQSLEQRLTALSVERSTVRTELALRVAESRRRFSVAAYLEDSDEFLDSLQDIFERILERQGNEFASQFKPDELMCERLMSTTSLMLLTPLIIRHSPIPRMLKYLI